MNEPLRYESIRVWDRFVRCFHWALVSCVAANLFVLEEGDPPHRWAGYAACALVLARIGWGFVGSRHARFADFFPTPSRLALHWRLLRAGRDDPHPGHNPLGALMMLALMGLVLALGVSGWLLGTESYWGEEWLEELHGGLATVLLASVGLHVLGALLMSRLSGIKLVRAMVTGVKQRPVRRDSR